MIQLTRLFENHFSGIDIRTEELRDFAEDFHGRLEGRGKLVSDADAPAYAELAAAIRSAWAELDAALGKRQAALASQQAGTLSKDDVVQFIRTTVRQREGRIRDAFGKGSPGYEAFFPRGLTEYARAPIGRIPALLDQFIAAADAHQAKTGADLLAEFRGLKATFTSARDRQVGKKGNLSEARAAVAQTRIALELALGVAVLSLARRHLGHPERAREFFNQSLLEDPTRTSAADATSP